MWSESLENFPYLLPYAKELKPKTIVHFGPGRSELVEAMAEAAGSRAASFNPAKDGEWTAAKARLLVSVDYLVSLPDDAIGPAIAHMAARAANAIIVIGAESADQPQGPSARDQDWWAERIGAHFEYLEPIRVRSKSDLAFKTWRSHDSNHLPHFMNFMREELKYKWRKIRGS